MSKSRAGWSAGNNSSHQPSPEQQGFLLQKKSFYLTEQAMTYSIFFSASVFSHIILCGHRDNHFSWIWGLVLGFSWYSCCPLTLCPQPALLKGHTVATVLLFMCQCVMLCCFEFLSDFFYFVDHVIILKLFSKRNKVSSLSYSKVLNLNNSTKNGDFFLSFLLICKTCLMLKIHFKIEKKHCTWIINLRTHLCSKIAS